MKLTKMRRKVLQSYRDLHGQYPTAGHLIRKHWKSYALLLAVFTFLLGFGVFLSFAWGFWGFAPFFAGMLVGGLSRDLGLTRQFQRVWPLLDHIIN